MAPKSILKNSTTSTNAPPMSRPVNQRHLRTALHHANILEHRKQVEQQVLDAVVDLLDFPTSPNADSQRPSASDARRFTEYLVPFQPSDYDALIEERNLAGRCGYALCPRPKGKAPSTARKHIIETDKGVEVVDRRVLEMWCSKDCARRALWVKVQLNEEPAWLRQGGAARAIELKVENEQEHKPNNLVLPFRPKTAPPTPAETEEDEVASAWAALDDAREALTVERGEKPGQPSKANDDLITATIQERVQTNLSPPAAPTLSNQQSHMAIEGHIPRATAQSIEELTISDNSEESEDDDDDQDWDIPF
ncbi:hypothetical protein M011DRAFT_493507 [Sporormia fimetaria CBS 119925]|uniref:RNA polymerase II subunit B1 CTD phosphatase RPAP2 homolog n=1 Tax=Sporormia fimetaria CBS 119925 TaxID=1340428 RepID=A0A6A6VDI9_9PLEO|nr:hypothetical protein M011DRAFT_493507 [Sporormia fimetaria CBS 119925]